MPTYEYECTKCGRVTDVFQPITDKPLRRFRKSDDPNCDCGVAVTRLLGRGAGIIFKGSGFYETDYRSDSYKKAAKAEKESSKGDGKEKAAKGADGKKKDSTPSKEKSSAKKED